MTIDIQAPICPVCSEPTVLFKSSARFYHGRDFGPTWACVDHKAWVRCHPGTVQPLGTPATREVRLARHLAHVDFDRLWRRFLLGAGRGQPRYKVRDMAYRWLGEQLGLPRDRMHMAMLDAEQCLAVQAACRPYLVGGLSYPPAWSDPGAAERVA